MIYSDYSIGEYKKQTYIPKICSKNFLTNICSRCILIPEQRFVLIHFEKEDEKYDKENPAKAVYFILFVDGNLVRQRIIARMADFAVDAG